MVFLRAALMYQVIVSDAFVYFMYFNRLISDTDMN